MNARLGRSPARLALAAGLVIAAASPARAEEDPFQLVREDQIVTGAAKRPQPLSETPSSVTVITQEEIRAHGYRTLGEALRYVRGLFVTSDRNYSYLGVRGIQRPGDYNDKVLLAFDGHTVNGNVFGDAAFGRELGLDLEAVERIEIVRGPGSALYGSHAALAVVNVVMKRPGRDPGLGAGGLYGAWKQGRGFLSMSSATPGGVAWSAVGSWYAARGADLYFPEYDRPETHHGRAVDADGEKSGSFFGTAEWSWLRFTAKWNWREKRIPTGAFGTTFGDTRNRTIDGHDFIEVSGTRSLSAITELSARAYWNGTRYHGFYIYGPDSATVVNFDRGDGDEAGAEVRLNLSAGPERVLTFGAEADRSFRIRMANYDQVPYQLFADVNTERGVWSAYSQLEQRVGSRLRLTAGARYDRDSEFGGEVSPRLDLVAALDRATTVKLLAGSAFRAPNTFETSYLSYLSAPNPNLVPERIRSAEAVLDRRFGRASASVSFYQNWIRNLIDLVAIDSLGTGQYQNQSKLSSRGVEAEALYVGPGGWRGRGSLALQDTDHAGTLEDLSNSPRWNASLVLTRAPARSPLTMALGVRYLSSRLTLAGNQTAEALVTDARVGFRLGSGWELGLEGRNLLDRRYADPGSTEHAEDQIRQDGRSVLFTLTSWSGIQL